MFGLTIAIDRVSCSALLANFSLDMAWLNARDFHQIHGDRVADESRQRLYLHLKGGSGVVSGHCLLTSQGSVGARSPTEKCHLEPYRLVRYRQSSRDLRVTLPICPQDCLVHEMVALLGEDPRIKMCRSMRRFVFSTQRKNDTSGGWA